MNTERLEVPSRWPERVALKVEVVVSQVRRVVTKALTTKVEAFEEKAVSVKCIGDLRVRCCCSRQEEWL